MALSNRSAFLRFSLIVIGVFVAETLVLLLDPKPFPLTAILPALVPILIVPFVVVPRNRANQVKK